MEHYVGSWEVFKAGQYHVFKKYLSSDGPSSSVASNLGAVVVTGEGGDPPWVSLAF